MSSDVHMASQGASPADVDQNVDGSGPAAFKLCHNTLSDEHLRIVEETFSNFENTAYPRIDISFSVFKCSEPELYGLVLGMFQQLGVIDLLSLSPSRTLDFIIDVNHGYQDNPYHCFRHGVDVLFMVFYILHYMEVYRFLDRLQITALSIASLCHDIAHPGLNNLFQVNAQTDLAQKYPDSILERHSISVTETLLEKHQLLKNIPLMELNQMEAAEEPTSAEKEIISLITEFIMSTDMEHHFELLEAFTEITELVLSEPHVYERCMESMDDIPLSYNCPSYRKWNNAATMNIKSDGDLSCQGYRRTLSITDSPGLISDDLKAEPLASNHPLRPTPSLSIEGADCLEESACQLPNHPSAAYLLNPDQRLTLGKVLLHAADISNTVRPWPLSKEWSDKVVEEFFLQGDLERQSNLQVSPNMDRESSDQTQISLKFGDLLVKPFFEVLADFMPGGNVFLDQLAANRGQWNAMTIQPISRSESPEQYIPSSPLLAHPGGRRVSVAAGTIMIPDDVHEMLKRYTSEGRKISRSLSGGGGRDPILRDFNRFRQSNGGGNSLERIDSVGETFQSFSLQSHSSFLDSSSSEYPSNWRTPFRSLHATNGALPSEATGPRRATSLDIGVIQRWKSYEVILDRMKAMPLEESRRLRLSPTTPTSHYSIRRSNSPTQPISPLGSVQEDTREKEKER